MIQAQRFFTCTCGPGKPSAVAHAAASSGTCLSRSGGSTASCNELHRRRQKLPECGSRLPAPNLRAGLLQFARQVSECSSPTRPCHMCIRAAAPLLTAGADGESDVCMQAAMSAVVHRVISAGQRTPYIGSRALVQNSHSALPSGQLTPYIGTQALVHNSHCALPSGRSPWQAHA